MNGNAFNPGDYVETNRGDRGTITWVSESGYNAKIKFDGGTDEQWATHNLTLINWLRPSPEAEVIANGGTLMLDERTEGWDVSLTPPPNDLIGAWQEAVAQGRTMVGLHEWLAELGPAGEADYEVSISNTFAAEDEQHAVALFIEWLTETGLTYTVREDYGDGEWGEPYYVETGDTEVEAVKVFGPGGLLEMTGPVDPECSECGRNDVVGSVGTLHWCTRHEANVRAMVD